MKNSRGAGEAWIAAAAYDALLQLHNRYAGYSTNPGRPLRFFSNLLSSVKTQSVIDVAHVVNAFSYQTGLPRLLLDDEAKLDVAETRRAELKSN